MGQVEMKKFQDCDGMRDQNYTFTGRPESKIIQVLAPDTFDVIQNRFLVQAFPYMKDVERERLLETCWIGNIPGMGTEDSFKKA